MSPRPWGPSNQPSPNPTRTPGHSWLQQPAYSAHSNIPQRRQGCICIAAPGVFILNSIFIPSLQGSSGSLCSPVTSRLRISCRASRKEDMPLRTLHPSRRDSKKKPALHVLATEEHLEGVGSQNSLFILTTFTPA